MADGDAAHSEKVPSTSSDNAVEPTSRRTKGFFRKHRPKDHKEPSTAGDVDVKPAVDAVPPVSFTQLFRSVPTISLSSGCICLPFQGIPLRSNYH